MDDPGAMATAAAAAATSPSSSPPQVMPVSAPWIVPTHAPAPAAPGTLVVYPTTQHTHIDARNRALNELLQLQSALIHGATAEFMETLAALPEARDSDFPAAARAAGGASLFPPRALRHAGGAGGDRSLLLTDGGAGGGGGDEEEKPPPGPLWSVADREKTMIGREEKIELDRIREIEEDLARRAKIRQLALELKEAENVKSVMTSGELVVRSAVNQEQLEGELLKAALAMKKATQKKEVLPERQAKTKLRELTRYLGGSTNRKILTSWGILDHHYMDAKEVKVTTKTNKQGGEYEARYPALRLSDLANILCSDDAKISASELPDLFMCLGASKEEAHTAIRIAAIKATLGPDNGVNLIYEAALKDELKACRSGIEDMLVSIEELKFVVFPRPEDHEGMRDLMLCTAEGDKLLTRWLQDREQAVEVKAKLDEQRQKALGMFMVAWKDVQVPKGPFDGRKQAILKKVIDYCDEVTTLHNKKREAVVPANLIKRLGIESFPAFLRRRLLIIVEAAEAEESRGHLEAKAKVTELFKLTIKQVRDDLDDIVFASDDKSASEGSVSSLMDQLPPSQFSSSSSLTAAAPLTTALVVAESPAPADTPAEDVPGPLLVKKPAADGTLKKKASKKPKMQRLDSSQIPPEPLDDTIRINLHSTPARAATVIQLLWETASLGKGFDGHAYKDVVMYLQAYSSIRIQAALRAYRRRWRYSAARRRWKEKEAVIAERSFHVWRHVARHDLDNRKYLWRKVKAWHFYTKRLNRLRYIFRVCHWPFFVWRRWACGRTAAKQKAKFLVTRVMPTLLELTVFRAWKKYALKGAMILRTEARLIKKKALEKLKEAFDWVHTWARKRRFIRRHWISRGVYMMRKIRFDRQNTPFQAWRMHVFYKKQVRLRIMANFNVFRNKFAPLLQPIGPESLPLRRKRFKRMLAEKLQDTASEGGFGLKGGSSLLSPKPDDDAASKGGSKVSQDIPMTNVSSISESHVELSSSVALSEEPSTAAADSKVDESVAGSPSGSAGGEGGAAASGGKSGRPGKSGGGVSLASTRSSFASNRTFGKKTKLAAAAALAQLRSRPQFDWKRKKRSRGHEMDSDDELDEPLAPKVSKCYETTLGMDPLPDPKELEFTRRCDEYTIAKIRNMLPKWRKWEVYAQIEYLGRFMRWAHRAFRHLRYFARHQKAGRIAKKKYWRKQELRVINRWVNWMAAKDAAVLEASRGVGAGQYTQAEILAHLVRRARRFRMTRRTQKYAEMRAMRAALAQDDNDVSPALKNKRGGRFPRRGSVVASNEDDKPASDAQLPANESATSLVSLGESSAGSRSRARESALLDADETLPRWDEEDRDAAEELAIRMANLSHRMKSEAFKKSSLSDLQNKTNTGGKERVDEMMLQVMKFENAITGAAVEQQEYYAIDFKRHAADILLDALAKVYEESQMQYIKGEARKYFRTLRIAMFMKRTKAMCNRKKMINWIRVCRRLTALQEHAHVCRSKRMMWVLFNRWLKFVEKEALDCSPDLVVEIIKRNEKHQRLTLYLEDLNFKRVVYTTSPRLKMAMQKLEALFLRWVMFTQEEKLYRMMSNRNHKLHMLRLMQRCFLAIKTSLPAREIYQLAKEHEREFFPIVRVTCDLEQIAKRFVAIRKRSVLHFIQKYNRKFVGLVRKEAKHETNYKKFKVEFKMQLAKRLTVEQRILSESFDMRGTQDFTDVAAPNESKRAQYLPAIMQRVDGRMISDPPSADVIDDEVDDEGSVGPINLGPSIKAKPVPGGFKLHKIRLNFLDQIGLVGWQFMWIGDGAEHIESPKRGQWVGAALQLKEITVDKDDFVIGIEYMYEGRGIVSMRFKMHFAGFSPWFGVKTSLATLTSYLDVEMAPSQEFEKYIAVLPEEQRRPACLRSFVVGFSAVWTGSRLSAISLVVRKVKDQNIFSYFWVQDALDAEAKALAESKVKMYEDGVRRRLPAISMNNSGAVRVGSAGGNSVAADADSDDMAHETRETTPGATSGMARQLAEQRKRDREKKRQEEEGFLLMTKRKQEGEIKKVELTPSDQEFFDLMRMRSTEVTAAEERVLAFSHRLWKDEKIARHPDLKKLVSLPLIRGLSKWLFDVLSKHLIGFKTADLRGSELLDEARRLRSHAASFARKKKVVVEMIYRAETAPRPWEGVSLLSPALRTARQAHKEKLADLNQRLEAIQTEEAAARTKALETEKAGRRLLPQIPLTIPICNNYRIKIAAARSKAALLQRMDVNVMKAAISNDSDTGKGIISQEDMRLAVTSLKTRDAKSVLSVDQSRFYSNKAELRNAIKAATQELSEEVDFEVERELQRMHEFDQDTSFQASRKNWEARRRSKMRRPQTPSRFVDPLRNKRPGGATTSKSMEFSKTHGHASENPLDGGANSLQLSATTITSHVKKMKGK